MTLNFKIDDTRKFQEVTPEEAEQHSRNGALSIAVSDEDDLIIEIQAGAGSEFFYITPKQLVREEEIPLLECVKQIKTWHSMGADKTLGQEEAEAMWEIYYERSPDLKFLRDRLGLRWEDVAKKIDSISEQK